MSSARSLDASSVHSPTRVGRTVSILTGRVPHANAEQIRMSQRNTRRGSIVTRAPWYVRATSGPRCPSNQATQVCGVVSMGTVFEKRDKAEKYSVQQGDTL